MKSIKISLILGSVITSLSHAAVVVEVESNNTPGTAQFLSPFSSTFGAMADVPEADNGFQHVTVSGFGDGSVDWYVYSHIGGRIIFDIDYAMNAQDLELGVWDVAGNLMADNDDGGITDPGSIHGFDSYIDLANLAAGLYYVAVSDFPSSKAANFVVGGAGVDTTYQLHISAVPETSTSLLSVFAFGALALRRRRA